MFTHVMFFAASVHLLAAASVTIPGMDVVSSIIGAIQTGGLIFGTAMMIGGALTWHHAAKSGSVGGDHKGRQLLLSGVICAFILGAAPAIAQQFFSLGSQVH